jgi:hypothetical protein
MATTIFNLNVPKKIKDKTKWQDVGIMFVNKDPKTGKQTISIKLNMFPELDIKAFKRDKQNQPQPQKVNVKVEEPTEVEEFDIEDV